MDRLCQLDLTENEMRCLDAVLEDYAEMVAERPLNFDALRKKVVESIVCIDALAKHRVSKSF